MKLTTQEGITVQTHEVELKGCIISCTPDHASKPIVCGVYKNREQAALVYGELACTGWNNDTPEYTMPSQDDTF